MCACLYVCLCWCSGNGSGRWRYPNDARQGSPGAETLTEGQVEHVLVSAVCSPRVFWLQRLDRSGERARCRDASARTRATSKCATGLLLREAHADVDAETGEDGDAEVDERPARLARLEAELTREAHTLEPMRPALLVPGAFCVAYDTHSKTCALSSRTICLLAYISSSSR